MNRVRTVNVPGGSPGTPPPEKPREPEHPPARTPHPEFEPPGRTPEEPFAPLPPPAQPNLPEPIEPGPQG
jgi:hypothetical protein